VDGTLSVVAVAVVHQELVLEAVVALEEVAMVDHMV
jgi:hypothetical protein